MPFHTADHAEWQFWHTKRTARVGIEQAQHIRALLVGDERELPAVARQIERFHIAAGALAQRRKPARGEIKSAKPEEFRSLVRANKKRFSILGKQPGGPGNLVCRFRREQLPGAGPRVTKVQPAFVD